MVIPPPPNLHHGWPSLDRKSRWLNASGFFVFVPVVYHTTKYAMGTDNGILSCDFDEHAGFGPGPLSTTSLSAGFPLKSAGLARRKDGGGGSTLE